MNHTNFEFVESAGEILVTLDCEQVVLPTGRSSLGSIRSYLESRALASQRVRRVDAVTVPLGEVPLLLLTTAARQVTKAQASVDAALTLVLINNPATARELWWNITSQLKEPVLTLSLMPESLCQTWCGTTFHKLRRWQLEQIAIIVQKVDDACDSLDNIQLSDALEKLVLPWLDRMAEHIRLWLDAMQAGARLGIKNS